MNIQRYCGAASTCQKAILLDKQLKKNYRLHIFAEITIIHPSNNSGCPHNCVYGMQMPLMVVWTLFLCVHVNESFPYAVHTVVLHYQYFFHKDTRSLAYYMNERLLWVCITKTIDAFDHEPRTVMGNHSNNVNWAAVSMVVLPVRCIPRHRGSTVAHVYPASTPCVRTLYVWV